MKMVEMTEKAETVERTAPCQTAEKTSRHKGKPKETQKRGMTMAFSSFINLLLILYHKIQIQYERIRTAELVKPG